MKVNEWKLYKGMQILHTFGVLLKTSVFLKFLKNHPVLIPVAPFKIQTDFINTPKIRND